MKVLHIVLVFLMLVSAGKLSAQVTSPDQPRPQEVKGWVQIPSGTGQVLATINVLPSGRIWVGGSEISMISDDSGLTWAPAPWGMPGSIRFCDDSAGVIIRNSPVRVHLTTNGGRDWQPSAETHMTAIDDIAAAGIDTFILVGAPGVSRSTDGGRTWSMMQLDGNMMSVHFFNSRYGVIGCQTVGNNYGIGFRTTDGGETWTKFYTAPFDWGGISSISQDTILAAYIGGHVSRSTDWGQTWKDTLLVTDDEGMDAIGSWKKKDIFLAGAMGRVFFSSDAGRTWERQITPTLQRLTDIRFLGDSVAIATGRGGVVLRTSNQGKSWVQVYPRFVPIPSQSFPEPFNTSTTIRFSLPGPARVSAMLFHPDGKIAKELLTSADLPFGTHEIPVDAKGLASGVYIYRIDADGLMATGRITLVK